MYSVPDVCVVNAGVLETTLVDAFDHCLGVVEAAVNLNNTRITLNAYVSFRSTPSFSSPVNSSPANSAIPQLSRLKRYEQILVKIVVFKRGESL